MKKLYLFIPLLLIFVVISNNTFAQKKNTIFGGNVIVGFPTGTLADNYTNAFGLEGLAGFGVANNVYLTGTVGYVSYAAESFNPYGRITVVPIKAGVRLYATDRFFLTGNAGVGLIKDETMDVRESRFTYDVGAGVQFSMFNASLHYDGWKKSNTTGSSNAVLLKLGIAIR